MPLVAMTGATSGFGLIAARQLATAGATTLRGARRATAESDIPLDLASLSSVRAFAADLGERLTPGSLDALVLNAGCIRPDDAGRTVDGFETTFAVNHLAHYLLARLCLPLLAPASTVVMTTSGTHDPRTKAGLRPPRHADPDLLAHPERDPGRDAAPTAAGQHAYTASKLCTVLTAQRLQREAGVDDRGVTVIAYDPGQVFGTGLAQHLSRPRRVAWALMSAPPLRRLAASASPTINGAASAGATLAALASGQMSLPRRPAYAALRRDELTWGEPSLVAQDDDLADALWQRSATLVGLGP